MNQVFGAVVAMIEIFELVFFKSITIIIPQYSPSKTKIH